MKTQLSLTGLLAATIVLASSLAQPASALTKGGAYAVCAALKQSQCPTGSYTNIYCKQMGRQYYSGGFIFCCKQWKCLEVH
jgi:hypothetical protein